MEHLLGATTVPAAGDLELSGRALFRPIHYLGGKWRLLDAIEAALQSLIPAGSIVADPFSGSGVVAGRLASRFRVIASDVQEYARVLASAVMRPVALPSDLVDRLLRMGRAREHEIRVAGINALIGHETHALEQADSGSANDLCEILEFGTLMGSRSLRRDGRLADVLRLAASTVPADTRTVLSRYYGGLYFSYEQAAALDGLAEAIEDIPEVFRDTARAALVSTASGIASTVGNHFAQPVRPRGADGRPKRRTIETTARRRRVEVRPTFRDWLGRYGALSAPAFVGSAFRSDYRDALIDVRGKAAAVYADPPYTRDHYSRFYHVLETIVLRDEPGISTVNVGGRVQASRGMYRTDRHQSPFCIKSQAPGAFSELFRLVGEVGIPLVLSYSPYAQGTAARPRVLTIEELRHLAREAFSSVAVQSAGRISHSKFNADHLNTSVSYEAEVLIICRP